MEVTGLHCRYCDTSVEGRFSVCNFCRLQEEQKNFVEIFLKARGNIKEVERELDISYPTVRKRLEEIVRDLGYQIEPPVDEEERAEKRREILARLDEGEIDAAEALKALREER